MLAFRLIARLDIKAPNLVKTVRLEGLRKVGDAASFARRYDAAGIDEIAYLDIVASLYGRNALGPLLDEITRDVFTPVLAGGGIRSIDDVRTLLNHGADKIAVNTAAVNDPSLIDALARKFGNSTITVQIDAKQRGAGQWEALADGGRQATRKDAVAWAEEAADRGAGEILLTSVDREGTGQGFDIALVGRVSELVPVPVVAAGGFGHPDHAVAAWKAGASGIAIAGALHYDRVSLNDIRIALADAGAPVRMTA